MLQFVVSNMVIILKTPEASFMTIICLQYLLQPILGSIIDTERRFYNIDTKGQFQIFSSIAAISVALADLKIDKRAVKKGATTLSLMALAMA